MKDSGRRSKNVEDKRFISQLPDFKGAQKKMVSKKRVEKMFDPKTEARNKATVDSREHKDWPSSEQSRRRIVDTTRGKESYSKIDTQVTPGKWKELNTTSY